MAPGPPDERTPDAAQWSTTVTPAVAALTTLCASTALAGVIEGLRWLGYAGIAIIVVAAVGMGLRSIRTPTLAVGLAQLVSLLLLVVALFTDEGILGVLPGPDAIAALGEVLGRSVEAVRVGVPPVDASAPVLCLVVIAIGLVAVLVDTLAVAAGAPAACGLVLLCVYAVPASLADDLLPWWSFVLGALSFTGLLAVDGAHRHQLWRNRPSIPAGGRGLGSPVAVVSGALALGLVAGVAVTGIGTVGGLPGAGGTGNGAGGLALKPFTSLRGMLDQGSNVELFRVRGLGNENRYLRAMTLPRFEPTGGWIAADTLSDAIPANGPLPAGLGDRGSGSVTRIEIEPVGSNDLWAPVYGIPRRMADLPQDMYYDQSGGMVYSRTTRKLDQYVEDADLSQPSVEDLRASGTDYDGLDPVYRDAEGISPRVAELAETLTRGKATAYDRAMALLQYFDRSNGFEYRTQTAASSDEAALTDFLFDSKVGFCEQYASAMAVLARAAGLPSRVAIGYTAGFASGDYRSITTQDAHAWVEVFFPNNGWVLFDPTPLSDGRGYQPPYAADPSAGGATTTAPEEQVPTGSAENAPTTTGEQAPAATDEAAPGQGATTTGFALPWQVWVALALVAVCAALSVLASRTRARAARLPAAAAAAAGALALFFLLSALSWFLGALLVLAVLLAVPLAVRGWQRREHREALTHQDPSAASAAWQELLAESWDRGSEVPPSDTVRTAARRLVKAHSLDEQGQTALRTVVTSVERSWYGGQSPDPHLTTAFDEVVRGLRRTAPLDWRSRLWPRSVVRPPRKPRQDPPQD
ncbi:hypothetical protein BJP25_10320 [Actinokineospora bangkokensis]|uniref:Transglutaminase-like domain-containing protein n=1 Tax=Actinokineospora bangkokensis TaxID=1193682 RepID=A0A1Q9LRQ1_9PSEU|nr:hypothetical protein BJP25_10320 [Actinokineospora bangkokensis]